MIGFYRDNQILLCDGEPLDSIAAELGTPCYVYSAPAIRARYRELDAAFAGHPHAIHYALKANSTLAIVRLLRELGAHADANSGGEIDVALRAGFTPGEIVFTGVGKTAGEIERAVGLGLKAINAESFGEMNRIDQTARALGTRARVAVRINPDIDAMSHPGISNIENYLETAGRIAVRAELGKRISFGAIVDLIWKTDHVISFADAGVDRDDDNDLVNPGTDEVNPLHAPQIDLVGHRYHSEDNFGLSIGVQAQLLF